MIKPALDTATAEANEPIQRPRAFRLVPLLVLLVFVGGSVLGVASLLLGGGSVTSPHLGRRSEAAFELPDDIRLPVLVDATEAWGLDGRLAVDDVDSMAGGLAVGDLDNDGDLDLVVTHGSVEIYLWDGTRFGEPQSITGAAVSSTVFDVDLDGWPDVLVARDGTTDLVVWGGSWVTKQMPPQDVTLLAGAAPTSLLLAGELSGDGQIDVVRLGRGAGRGVRDIVWEANPGDPREFSEVALGDDERASLAGELVDVDEDGLLDVWVTRDVGWDIGGDSVYSRRGSADGPWVDIAPDVGADLEVDGMGVTIADLDDDGRLDAYVSDLGDNEVLVRNDHRFERMTDTGAARIRATGAPSTTISSSWASGAIDVNLDGRLDLVVVNGGFAEGGMRNKIPGTEIAVVDSPAILLGIGEGRFVDVWPRMTLLSDTSDRGLTVADVDGDGDDDLLVLSDEGAIRAIENTTSGRTVTVTTAPGCDATGAIVTIETDARTFMTLMRPHSYGGGHSPVVIAGIGDDLDAAISVEWTDGTTTTLSAGLGSERPVVAATC